MNAPVPPPVGLENLRNVSTLARPRSSSRFAAPVAAALIGAAGLTAWRLASMVNAQSRSRRRARRNRWLTGGIGLAALGVARWQLQRLFTRQPEHAVEMRRGPLEIRRYPAVRIAETTVDAAWDEALDLGFRRLAAFIFGGNDSKKQIAMTAPVLGTGDRTGFRVAFVLPDDVVAPVPDDARIGVTELPSRRVAVLRFSGRYDADAIEAQKAELTHALVANGLHPRGEASFAGYDPPFTLPLLRRNELWVEVEEQIV